MEITLFFCEHAVTRADGKLDTSGIFNELYSSGFPAKQERVILAGIVEWDRDVEGLIDFKIQLLDPGKKPIFTISGNSEIDARSTSRPPAKSHFIFPLENLVFTEPGEYEVSLETLNKQFTGPSLYVLKT